MAKQEIELINLGEEEKFDYPEPVWLSAVLMPNGEIISSGKTIGFIGVQILKKYIFRSV